MSDITGLMITFCLAFGGLLYYTYDNLEYKGYPRNSSCYGECYEEYIKEHGTVVEQLKAKQAEAAGDPFSSIRGLWAGCAACHGTGCNAGSSADSGRYCTVECALGCRTRRASVCRAAFTVQSNV